MDIGGIGEEAPTKRCSGCIEGREGGLGWVRRVVFCYWRVVGVVVEFFGFDAEEVWKVESVELKRDGQ